MFVSTANRVAEVSIPELVTSNRIEDLPIAEILQPITDPSEGRWKEVAAADVVLSGLLVHDRRLFASGIISYDANNTQTVSHFTRSLSLLEKSASPLQRVGDPGKAGFVAGYMATVPIEWRTLLGAPAITGQCCVSIVSRTSLGPAAWAWDPQELVSGRPARASSLVHYESNHTTLGPWNGSNPTYGGTTMVGGVALINGTRTAVFLGSNGTGPFCYGDGVPNRAAAEKTGNCYDPARADKGQHAYPYRYQMWAYDLNDWAAVKAGTKQPWEVVPYAVWPFELPFPEPGTKIGGVAFDSVRRLLYFAQLKAEQGGFAYRPIMHAYFIP